MRPARPADEPSLEWSLATRVAACAGPCSRYSSSFFPQGPAASIGFDHAVASVRSNRADTEPVVVLGPRRCAKPAMSSFRRGCRVPRSANWGGRVRSWIRRCSARATRVVRRTPQSDSRATPTPRAKPPGYPSNADRRSRPHNSMVHRRQKRWSCARRRAPKRAGRRTRRGPPRGAICEWSVSPQPRFPSSNAHSHPISSLRVSHRYSFLEL